ncbi:type II toxin-antitoxin system death-on-curing family toxin [Streptomyces griseoluteus]|uniref:Type II toxin-antitoxin system death-on-curing family toxin n=1 Tax=Streptomyces griseoluteus TaxID=29306 RepID=A0A4Z1D4Y2_STRGP|nr:type II toxin-antitoxin system death-on-curing family toxin [Streptomyces griseoluteus]TGN77390.1 type II toxin-antitoxin system death-on-curing family toxin [Streptomyces griseoluteus]GHF25871.1 toxin Doc [Streptomyces griseoluteus]
MTCIYLSAEDVLSIAGHAVDDQDVVVRDVGLLESAVHRPSASMFGQEAYTDLFDKAAALLQSLAVNRPFVDGNKRTAWVSCMVFLAMNGRQLRADIDAGERLVIAVATGSVDEIKAISEALRDLAEPAV